MTADYTVSRIALHPWEEPPISGTRGSGTVFFAGCNLRCVFCQNRAISREGVGSVISEDDLIRRLVTPTHYTDSLVRLLTKLKPRLHIPVVWNSSGYESVESIRMLEGLVDVYLPDFKYMSPDLAAAYSAAPDYPTVATEAVREMYRQTGPITFDGEGIARKGVIVRHLVLPGCRKDSIAVLRHLASILPISDIRVSVMRQYTPDFAMDCPHKNLRRRVTEFEYDSVLTQADELGIVGYRQGKDAAQRAYTPDFGKL